MPRIFISYRRDDSAGYAGRLHDHLSDRFGRDKLFMDVDGIPIGVNFVQVLTHEVAKCDVLLVLIGRRWANASHADGRRRLDDPADFVRIEIEAALQRHIPVVPVLVDGAEMPTPAELPHSLAELVWRNGASLRHASFKTDVTKLMEGLAALVPAEFAEPGRKPPPEPTRQPEPKVRPRPDSRPAPAQPRAKPPRRPKPSPPREARQEKNKDPVPGLIAAMVLGIVLFEAYRVIMFSEYAEFTHDLGTMLLLEFPTLTNPAIGTLVAVPYLVILAGIAGVCVRARSFPIDVIFLAAMLISVHTVVLSLARALEIRGGRTLELLAGLPDVGWYFYQDDAAAYVVGVFIFGLYLGPRLAARR